MNEPASLPVNYVLANEWRDAEYHALSQVITRPLTKAEADRLVAGPRVHPFGPGAHMKVVAGECRVYPSREAAGE